MRDSNLYETDVSIVLRYSYNFIVRAGRLDGILRPWLFSLYKTINVDILIFLNSIFNRDCKKVKSHVLRLYSTFDLVKAFSKTFKHYV